MVGILHSSLWLFRLRFNDGRLSRLDLGLAEDWGVNVDKVDERQLLEVVTLSTCVMHFLETLSCHLLAMFLQLTLVHG